MLAVDLPRGTTIDADAMQHADDMQKDLGASERQVHDLQLQLHGVEVVDVDTGELSWRFGQMSLEPASKRLKTVQSGGLELKLQANVLRVKKEESQAGQMLRQSTAEEQQAYEDLEDTRGDYQTQINFTSFLQQKVDELVALALASGADVPEVNSIKNRKYSSQIDVATPPPDLD